MRTRELFFAIMISSATPPVWADTVLKWSAKSDILSLDPHVASEVLTASTLANIYESLVDRNPDMAFVPGLATHWSRLSELVWEFELREGVRFHNGETFDADDVVFSFKRAAAESSEFARILSNIEHVEKVTNTIIRIHTQQPNPILPSQITTIKIMDSGWAVENGMRHADLDNPGRIRVANGTGPYVYHAWVPGEELVLKANKAWWNRPLQSQSMDLLYFHPIQDDQARTDALLTGGIDLVVDPAFSTLSSIEKSRTARIQTVPGILSVFLGMNINSQQNNGSDDPNPFADIRVRQSVRLGLDLQSLHKDVMQGLSYPAGMLVAPGVLGHDLQLDQPGIFDRDAARALLSDAGYDKGFDMRLDCPNDRYLKDREICLWVSQQLAEIGIRTEVNDAPRKEHFARVKSKKTDFFLLGWATPGLDSGYVFNFLLDAQGSWNATGFDNEEVNTRLAEADREDNILLRSAIFQELWKVVDNELPYIPLHHQIIVWAMRNDLNIPLSSDNRVRLHLVSH